MTRKYQQGGSAQDELNQFAQDIILNQLFGEDTEAKLLQLAKELPQVILLLFLIWKQAGIEGVVKALQQALKAARGAKLNRVMALSNRCPQGYMKKGGKCKKCERGNKLDPTKGVFHINGYFKNGGRSNLMYNGVGNNTYSYLEGTDKDGVKRKEDYNANNNIIGYDNTVRGKGEYNELPEVTATPSRLDNMFLKTLRTSPEMLKPIIRRSWQKALDVRKSWQDGSVSIREILPFPIEFPLYPYQMK